MKKGISLIILAVTIIIMAILAGVIVRTGGNSVDLFEVNKFAIELLNIQTSVDEYVLEKGSYPVKTSITFDTSAVPTTEIYQFQSEEVIDNSIIFKEIDLSLLGITDTTFGNNNNAKDIYVVSELTGKVYYLSGVKLKEKVYYTLDKDLYDTINFTPSSNITPKEIKQYDVLFKISNTNPTNQPITIEIRVPKEATLTSVIATNSKSVSAESVEGAYKIVKVNETSEDKTGNYAVTVNYTYNKTNKVAAYEVTNYDNVAPIFIIAEAVNDEVKTIDIYSESNDIKYMKYENGIISDETYFSTYGKQVLNNKITMHEEQGYTIYAQDNAGNIMLKTYGWVQKEDLNKNMTIVTNGTQVLNVGDEINYVATGSDYSGKWQVLGSSDEGNLLIVSADIITETVTLNGKAGYKNSLNMLNDKCSSYGNGFGAKSVRSITIQDIDKITEYNKTAYGSDISKYGTKTNFYWDGTAKPYYIFNKNEGTMNNDHAIFEWFDGINWLKSVQDTTASTDSKKHIVELESKYYTYVGQDEFETTSKEYVLLFRDSSNALNAEYWLASRNVNVTTDNAKFGMYKVYDGAISSETLYTSDSTSAEVTKGVKVVVELKLDVEITGSSVEGWEIVEELN